jgi:prepilin-type N-terminal cleavage/methylation domain-containing protein
MKFRAATAVPAPSLFFQKRRAAFTLIEMMIVIGIMGMLLTLSVPAVVDMMDKKGMRRATSDILEGCQKARAEAILKDQIAELVIYPTAGRIEVQLEGGVQRRTSSEQQAPRATIASKESFAGLIPPTVYIELLGVNFHELQKAESAIVRFYPNGTSDEFTIIMRSAKGEWARVDLEVITALAQLKTLK